MVYFILSVVLVIVAIVGLSLRAKVLYYRKIFSPEHYRQIGEWAVNALQMGPVERPSMEDGSAIITDAGVAVGFSRVIEEECDRVHFSVSQRQGPTTHAVGSRLIFFLMQILNRNVSNGDCWYSKSTVHHFVLQKEEAGDWLINPVEEAITRMDAYRPMPLELRDIPPPE